jgi:hypothetical protein
VEKLRLSPNKVSSTAKPLGQKKCNDNEFFFHHGKVTPNYTLLENKACAQLLPNNQLDNSKHPINQKEFIVHDYLITHIHCAYMI